ncbi:MAG: ATP-binding protein [Theionarchaea archaeon]|nr:ATP-binding protein [Theionarchaea archaeon]
MDFEKLGAFYLGKEYDSTQEQLLDRLVMYDARDLTTHAVCVGMTGSGKTGLCIDLLEEAAIDHVPALIIDPKGDITNLLLTFPELHTENFRPWVNVDDARRKGLSLDEFAAQQAELWKNGLAQWGQDGARIRLLKESAEFMIYTPGSDAGIPVSILQSFSAPQLDWNTNSELLRERIGGMVSALLGLIGVEADPVRSREHILLSTLFEHFWRKGEDLDLRTLILSIQDPPVRELGVFDVDTFFPKKERFELAMNLNNILASPGFQSWLQGQPLDIPGFLTTPQGKTRHSIFYIAHLSDAERMFFVTMLLNQVITWMRTQPGTTSLRSLLYMDEIFGFFPPVANPPSKQPMLTLLKQARAFGLGVVLTTQNPVDLDYKGLTNAGTWFIGRLQTERDKLRVLDGLEGASSEAGQILNRSELSRIISDLGNRVFLLHNVHEPAPITFQTRWAMSYLRGPLTRPQVRQLMGERVPDNPVETPLTRSGMGKHEPVTVVPESMKVSTIMPPLLPDIQQVYIPVRRGVQTAFQADIPGGGQITSHSCVYVPAVMGTGSVRFMDQRRNVDDTEEFILLLEPTKTGMVSWDQARTLDITPAEFLATPAPDSSFNQLPPSMNEPQELNRLEKELTDHIYRTSTITLSYSPTLKMHSLPSEPERDFQLRLTQEAREQRDEEVDKLTRKYEKKLDSLERKLEKAELSLDKKKTKASTRKTEIAVSVGESVVGMFLGRRSTRAASTALSKYRQSKSAQMDVKEAEEKVEALQEEVAALEKELTEETEKIKIRWDESLQELQEISIRPRKSDIVVRMVAVAWLPHWQVDYGDGQGKPTRRILPAYQKIS